MRAILLPAAILLLTAAPALAQDTTATINIAGVANDITTPAGEDLTLVPGTNGNVVIAAGGLKAPQGTPLLPAYGFTQTPGVGILVDASSNLGFASSGTQRISMSQNNFAPTFANAIALGYSSLPFSEAIVSRYESPVTAIAVADDGALTSVPITLTATTSLIAVDCRDTSGGCVATISTSGIPPGMEVTVVNVGVGVLTLNTVPVTTSMGQVVLGGSIACQTGIGVRFAYVPAPTSFYWAQVQ